MDKLKEQKDLKERLQDYVPEPSQFTNIKKWDEKTLTEILHRLMHIRELSIEDVIRIVNEMKKEYLHKDELTITLMKKEK